MTTEKKVKLAIIGCGAVTEERYLPAAAFVPNLIITHVVDLDLERGREIANRFQISNFVSDYHELFGQVDAVVVATPPRSHAKISIDCLNHGLHVLCEKPLAPLTQEAEAMIAASQQSHTLLAIGMIRRLSWSSQLLKRLVKTGILGNIHRFDVEEGGEFGWPLRTGHIFQDSTAGGVLMDTGVHIFDLLLWSLGSQRAQLVSYKDDNWSGVEANAAVELVVEGNSGPIPGRVELSLTRKLRNTLKIYGETGCLEAPTLGGAEVLFYPDDETSEPVIITPQKASPRKRIEDFTLQLSNFADSVVNHSKKYVAAEETVMTISLIEQCHRSRESIAQPWEVKHLESFFEAKHNGR